MNAKIESIKLTVGGREIVLTYEEAQALHNELAQIFRQTIGPPMVIERHIHTGGIGSSYPYIPAYRPWEITCGGLASICSQQVP